jgi:hypothetical protein
LFKCSFFFSPDPPPYSPWNPFSSSLQSQQHAEFNEPPPAYVTVESETRDTTDVTHVERSPISQGLGNVESNAQPSPMSQGVTFEQSNGNLRDTTDVTHTQPSPMSQEMTFGESDGPTNVGNSNDLTHTDSFVTSHQERLTIVYSYCACPNMVIQHENPRNSKSVVLIFNQ